MKAVVYEKYGGLEVLQLKDLEKPVPRENEILVNVKNTTVTPGDWRLRKADPFAARLYNGLFRPRKISVLGFEFAGVVEAVGSQVTQFQPGDRVFGHNSFGFGGYAEYLCVKENGEKNKGIMAKIPDGVSFEDVVALPIGATAAIKKLELGEIKAGQQVLINGASGSVGTYSVILAKHYGAIVTGVCSTRNLDFVRELGADHVWDYTAGDITEKEERFDLIYDAVGKHVSKISKARFQKLLKPGGRYVGVEMNTRTRAEDLDTLAGLVQAGHLKTIVDRTYPLEEIVEAHRYVEKGRKRGNVIVKI